MPNVSTFSSDANINNTLVCAFTFIIVLLPVFKNGLNLLHLTESESDLKCTNLALAINKHCLLCS